MREIKFRKLLSGHWIYWTPADGDNGFWEYTRINENQCIVEYTGLKDKNGKQIYEGDILSILRKRYSGPWETYWTYDKWGLKDKYGDYDNGDYYRGDDICWEDFEVIGNIYENPELLND